MLQKWYNIYIRKEGMILFLFQDPKLRSS